MKYRDLPFSNDWKELKYRDLPFSLLFSGIWLVIKVIMVIVVELIGISLWKMLDFLKKTKYALIGGKNE